MDEEIRQKILTLLDQHRIMTLATLRPDGALEGSGTVDVAGRLVTGVTDSGVTFAPHTERCAVSTLAVTK